MKRKQRRAEDQDPLHRRHAERGARHSVRAPVPDPVSGQAHNEIGSQLLLAGRLEEASTHFAQALELVPELFEEYLQVVATLLRVNPQIREGFGRVGDSWPRELSVDEVLGRDGIAGIANDPMLRCMLESGPIRDINLERYLTSVRRFVLDLACEPRKSENVKLSVLRLCCALAKQCFINEYVFAVTPKQMEQAQQLRKKLADALASGRAIAPLLTIVVASYFPLSELPHAQSLLERTWPEPVRGVLAQQLVEPAEEQDYRDTIPRLTEIDDKISQLVQQQYEENPYPRWVSLVAGREPLSVHEYLRRQFPMASFSSPDSASASEILVAGCGTGQEAIINARRFANANVLAVDLSLASLCYAKRMSEKFGIDNIEYAHADLLRLASIGRTFDMIAASGVLHHLAGPLEGWRVLLDLLRPGGVMLIALYSKVARQHVNAARAFVTAQGFPPTPDGIRRARNELLGTPAPVKGIASHGDFFSISECRDLLFHVQEQQFTLPEIASFLEEHKLQLIGFEMHPAIAVKYRSRFPDDPAMTDLGSWELFERENPATFVAMYQFWIQKS
jgi:SAM-dependent methyltransferase